MSDRVYHLGIRAAAYPRHSGDGVYVENLMRLDHERLKVTTGRDMHLAGRVRRRLAASSTGLAKRKLQESMFVASMLGERQIGGSEDALLCHILVPTGRRHVPVLWSSQGLSTDQYYRFVSRDRVGANVVAAAYRRLSVRADILLIWCETGAARLVDACPELASRIVVIHPPVDVPQSLPPKPSLFDGSTRFLFVGMDWYRKGLDILVEAFEHISASRVDWQLDVVTKLSATSPLHARLSRVGAIVHGDMNHDEVTSLMLQSDVLVFPSRADTYGLVLVEAMAQGCAVICSLIEPLAEVAGAGVAGMAVGRVDLTGAIMSVLDDHSALRRMQLAARGVVGDRNHRSVVAASLLGCLDTLDLASRD